MFKSKKEFAQAMIDGRRFRTPDGDVFYYDEEFASPFRVGRHNGGVLPLGESWVHYTQVTEILPWQRNIPPQGVLCRVWDDPSIKQWAVIIGFEKHEAHPYISIDGHRWTNAKLMLLEEIEPLIYRE